MTYSSSAVFSISPVRPCSRATTHGNFECAGSKNDDNLNWVNVKFDFDMPDILIKVQRKSLITEDKPMPTIVHQYNCRCRNEDASGEITKWSDFN